jgi:DNA-binding NtrC family response regulator
LDSPRAVVLGRAPNASAAPVEGRPLESCAVAGPSVSANHALVWCEAETICVRDLGSRNGTWILLPRRETVRIGGGEVVLQLGQSVGGIAAEGEPAEPGSTDRCDYGSAIAASIEKWLRDRGIEVRVTVIEDLDENSRATCLPLATDEALEIVPLGTVDASWPRLLELLWRWTARQNAIYDAEEETRREGMILASKVIREAHREVVDAAKAGATTLLLTGPSGSGKEVLAEAFHRHSGRSGPFVPVNCALFTRDLLRSELFGAEVGAFTGATRRIVGAVERASGGTLFLDEIGEVAPEVQAMLLRFLDRREYERLGQPGKTRSADVRVVAATNRELREATRSGSFRADLWFRLSVHEVEVPSLRARWDDVMAYLESVRLADASCSARAALSAEALEVLRTHPWEGNFRELATFAARLPRAARNGEIDAATCRRALERGSLRPSSPPPQPEATLRPDWAALVERSLRAFREDHGVAPGTWDDQKEWNEKYLKPLLFYHLSGASDLPVPIDEGGMSALAAKAAARVQADRGTAAKQIARYYERFRF